MYLKYKFERPKPRSEVICTPKVSNFWGAYHYSFGGFNFFLQNSCRAGTPSSVVSQMVSKSIGKALKMSKKIVIKYVKSLEDKCLITTEHTTVTLKSGKKQNGNLRYTILPIKEAKDYFYRRQMMKLEFNLRNKNKVFLDEKNQAV